MIKVYIESDYESMSRHAARLLVEVFLIKSKEKEHIVFVPSAGGTPTRLYQVLCSEFKESFDWSRIVLCQMDDYVGLPPAHPNSLAYYLFTHIIKPLGIQKYYFLNNSNGPPVYKGLDYEILLQELGGIDVFVHGIGENGHLGFNEPGSSFDSTTRIVKLSESTRKANKRFFGENKVPGQGITMGLSNIFKADTNLVMASGEKKRETIKRMLLNKAGPATPASILQKHKSSYLFLDEKAADKDVLERFGKSTG